MYKKTIIINDDRPRCGQFHKRRRQFYISNLFLWLIQ